ncbi:MAG TPA: M23 family metallopeptidase [Anaerolineae bacterium]|nr:M23 family metallopeptidase [Anaerolineae bacterium]
MTKDGLSVCPLVETKKVIPIYFKNGDTWHTNVKLPDLLLRNHPQGPTVTLGGIVLSAIADGKQVASFQQDEEGVRNVISETNALMNRLTQPPASPWKAYNLHMLFGDVPMPQEPYAESHQLEPGQATCLRLQDLFPFHYAGREKIDEIVCTIEAASESGSQTIETRIRLTPYRCVGDYIFPIAGSATIMGTPWNDVFGHRMANSQEFAVDVVDYRRGDDGRFALSSPPGSENVKDYFLFEREVLAVGDGIVVSAGNQWPNRWAENPLNYSEERIVEITLELLEKGMDFNHAILGNYVIIDHENGEFSLYAHMSEGTVTVDAGDAVKQGQVIGKVGNTSNSDSPHLHFHLMDSPDFQTANGLPVLFKNVPLGQAPLSDFKESNSLLYSDYLFAFADRENV